MEYVDGYAAYLRETKNASHNTLESYLRDIRQFLAFLDHESQPLEQVTAPVIEQYLHVLQQQGKTPATLTRSLSSVRSFFNYLMLQHVIQMNPTRQIKLDKAEKKLPEILTKAEVEALLRQPDLLTVKGCRDRTILELLYETGLRVTELIDLNVDDLNMQLSILTVRTDRKERIIPLYNAAIKVLSDYMLRIRPAIVKDRSEKSLFLNMNGDRLTRQGLWKIIKYYTQAAGIQKSITPHTLRHSLAAHMLENGADLKDIKEILGHADISSTQIYGRLVKNKYAKSFNRFHPRADV